MPSAPAAHLHLGVDLDGAGHHPAAWREPNVRPAELFAADYFVDLVQRAERGRLDFVTIGDSFGLQPAARGDVRGRLDALLTLARVAPTTRAIGLVPEVTVTHTEPFHVSKNIATLDYVSHGRAGWKVGVSSDPSEACHFGRKAAVPDPELYEEAEAAVDVIVRLWDSWEDDAVVRDIVTGRYIDRDKIHYVDFESRFFNVRGPSITPRPPQGHPIVAVDATRDVALVIAATHADIVFVDAADAGRARQRRDRVRAAARAVGRDPDTVAVLANVDIVLEHDAAAARSVRRRLDARGGRSGPAAQPPTLDVVGTPFGLAGILEDWFTRGAVDGFNVRPARLPDDLDLLVDGVVPVLRERGVFRLAYEGTTLRDHLGLARPLNRYAATT
ncbi:MAG TPA: LLM class flavin-dependent oxidoreductase [Acidimicrobiia bacterium]|nr:LLM class flavin-dependent oxidoreductase [Acidimicrobiia bacterium]